MLHQSIEQAPEASSRPDAILQRSFEVEYNQWQRYPWMLRCYGRGVDSIANGVPKHFRDELTAQSCGMAWVANGRAS